MKAWDAATALMLAASAAAYIMGSRHGWERAAFWSGWAALVVALLSPLHTWGETSFAAHMWQHEILMLVASPLLVLGRMDDAVLRALPRGPRRGAGRMLRFLRPVLQPMPAWTLHASLLWLWHVPRLLLDGLRSDGVHALQHVSFFGSALVFWWSVLRCPRSQDGLAVFSLFTTTLHTGALGALLTLASTPWYRPVYTLEDQQMGGLIMWIPGGLLYTAAGLLRFGRWLAAPATGTLLLLLTALQTGCVASLAIPDYEGEAARLTGGSPATGRMLIESHGCASCHTIPGIRNAKATVGPPLTAMANRSYIGGVLPNTPEDMQRWLLNPPGVDGLTAMPNLGLGPEQARHIAAYLYTLR